MRIREKHGLYGCLITEVNDDVPITSYKVTPEDK